MLIRAKLLTSYIMLLLKKEDNSRFVDIKVFNLQSVTIKLWEYCMSYPLLWETLRI